MYWDNKCIDVLFFIEHRDRELQSVCAVVKELKERYNLSVGVASLEYHLLSAWLKVRPKVIVIPYGKSEKNVVVRIFKAIYGNQIDFVNLNLEQILSSYTKKVKEPRDNFAKNQLKQLCWGEQFKDFLLESGVNEKNIVITGRPETTLLLAMAKNENRNTRGEISNKLGLPKEKRWIFFPLNDGAAFADARQIQRGIKKGNRGKESLTIKKYAWESLQILIDWFIRLEQDKREKDFIIILRPHPTVSIKEYIRIFEEKMGSIPSYIFISREMTVKEWIIACDACYTNFSTVAIDASGIHKPSYIIETESFPDCINAPWLQAFSHINSYTKFSEALYNQTFDSLDCINLIDSFIDTKLNAIEEIAAYVCELAEEKTYITANWVNFIKGFLMEPVKILRSYARLLDIKSGLKLFTKEGIRYDYFTRKDVIEAIESLPTEY